MAEERRRADRRQGGDRRGHWRGPDRRRGDRRVAFAAGLTVLVLGCAQAEADVFVRRNANGVIEATDQPGGEPGYKLAYRSKGRVMHSPGFRAPARAPAHLEPVILDAAAREGVDAALVRAVIRVESAFDERAVSSAGARGLMQLMPDTAQRFGVLDAFDPVQNIRAGTRYLAFLLRLFGGDVALAAAGYNAGEGAVRRHGGIPPYRETRDYVRKIETLLAPVAAAAEPPRSGMMTFTPGSEGRVSAALDKHPARAAGRAVLYRWRDARGVVHVSGTPPPPGVEYAVVRSE